MSENVASLPGRHDVMSSHAPKYFIFLSTPFSKNYDNVFVNVLYENGRCLTTRWHHKVDTISDGICTKKARERKTIALYFRRSP